MRAKKVESEFAEWFVAQHGQRDNIAVTDNDLSAAVRDGERAGSELARRRVWDKQFGSALSAWQAASIGDAKGR
jgi:hypothetical protein